MWADLSVFSKLQYLLTTEKTPHLHLILSLSYVMRYETTHIIVYCQNTYQWRPSSPDQRRWHSLLELVAVGTSDEFKWSAVAPHLQIITWWYHTGCNVFWCSNLASIEMAISYCKVHVTRHQESKYRKHWKSLGKLVMKLFGIFALSQVLFWSTVFVILFTKKLIYAH